MGDESIRAMTPASSEQAVFAEALQCATSEARAAYLDAACGTDAALRRRVEALLRAAENAGDFLEQPPAGLSGDTESTSLVSELIEKPGDRIGRYKLLEKIGEGGCGVVYMAEQEEPVRRRVALKIIKLGMDTRSVVARFEAERQALALMDHPNIAKVHDGGATQTGRPYFVMELVRGVHITEFCDQARLSTEARLRLFVQVCQAIQHAHQKGIIHRDLKPSNILVTVNDGAPVPKVIDFGIAKATGQRLTDKTLFTQFHSFIGTPAYTSPEQAEMSSVDIDTRSDIYSLGVLLYELLTGRTPFDGEQLLRSGLDEMRRIIRDEQPLRPSNRLDTLGMAEATALSVKRRVSVSELAGDVRGDLDWVMMKCLEKDRTRRYESANELAVDLKRHLENETVAARPPSQLYRFQKFVRRNKVAFSAAAAVSVALVLGLCVAMWALVRERAARGRLEATQKLVKAEAVKNDQAAQFLKEMMYGVIPAISGDRARMPEMIRGFDQRLDRMKDQPLVQADVRNILAVAYLELGDPTNAAIMRREALALRKKVLGDNHPGVADSLNDFAEMLFASGKHSEAAELHREVLAMRRKLFGNEHADVAQSLHNLAYALARQGRSKYAETEPFNREALAIRRKVFGNEHREVARSLNDLGLVLWGLGQYVEAETLHREALAIRRKLLGDEHADVATSLDRLGLALDGQRRFAEAETILRESLAMRRKLLGTEHPNLVWSLHNLAGVLRNQGKVDEAAELTREAQSMKDRLTVKPGAAAR